MMHIVSLCGSLQARSSNRTLLAAIAARIPAGVRVDQYDGIAELPHFNLDLEEYGPVPEVATWRAQLGACDGVLIAAPEYGHSLPGALKNAID